MESAPTNSEQEPLRNIILIGFMGSGKSTVGKILHKKIGYPHIDTDQVIEAETNSSISNIFAKSGEEHFRNLETETLQQLINNRCQETIISTGGGIITRAANIPLLRQLGFVVWLACSPEEIHQRTARNNNRPLLQCDDPMAAIKDMLQTREPLYDQAAHLKINTSGLQFDEIAHGIQESASYHFTNSQS